MSDKQNAFKKAYADINEMSLAQVDEILAIQDKQVTKFSRIKTCEKLWNAAIESMQEEIDKRDSIIDEIFSVVAQRCPDVLTHKMAGDAVEEIISEFLKTKRSER